METSNAMSPQVSPSSYWISGLGLVILPLVVMYTPGNLGSPLAVGLVFLLSYLEKSGNVFASVGFRKKDRTWKQLGIWAPLCAIGLTLLYVFVLAPLAQGITGEALDLSAFDALRDDPLALIVTLPVVWAIAAFGEEIVFRGYMMQRFTRLFGNSKLSLVLNILLISAVFGYAHNYQGLSGILLAGTTGAILATIFHFKRYNLWFNIIIHGVVDTFALVIFYLGAHDYLF